MEHDDAQVGALVRARNEADRQVAAHRNERAKERVLERADVLTVEILADGCLRCVGHDGSVTIRAAGWKPRG